MKMYYCFMCMWFCWLVPAMSMYAQSVDSPSKEKTVSDVEGRTVYAVVSYNSNLDGYGVTTFKTGSQQEMTLLHAWGNSLSILAGAAAHGEYYGYFYQYDNLEGVLPIAISKISLRSGAITDVIDLFDFKIKFQDMTFDYSTNTMYAVGFDFGTSKLYILDIENGEIIEGPELKTNAGKMTIATLAATYDGRLYGLNPKGVLYQIDKETGALTRILDTQLHLQSMQSMEFDHTDESLYWAADIENGQNPDLLNSLYKIDIENRTIKSVGPLGTPGTRAVGLYIPFVEAGFDAPGQATDLLVTPGSQGKEEAVITWKNPTKTHGGDALTGDLTVTLERDGEVISSSFSEAGTEMAWTDKSVKQGERLYTVKITNGVGEGLRADYDAYIGHDVPGRTTDLAVSVGSECKSIKLSWTVPEKGLHNGFYEPSAVKYKIVRYPDNVILEDDYSGTSYEDSSMKRLGAYYYGITASNEAGTNQEYVKKETVVAGKAVDIPYSIGFEDETLALNQWSVLNANNDGSFWHLNSGFDVLIYGSGFGATGVDYVADKQTSQLDADEWLISPPLNLEADKDYYISFDARSAGVDELNITFGELNTPASQTQFIKSGFFTVPADPENPTFTNYKFQLPKGGGIHCVGFNLVTVFGESLMFQMNNLEIVEGLTGIETLSADSEIKVCQTGNRLAIEGDFRVADIYDTTGVWIASLSQDRAQLTTSGWQPGIYIIKVACADTVYTKKIRVK